MNEQDLNDIYQREFEIAKTTFQQDKSIESIYENVKSYHKRLDKLISNIIKEYSIKFECQKGCSHCCTLYVAAPYYEIIAITKYINDTLSDTQKTALITKLADVSQKAIGLKPEEYNIPCAMLENNICSIYEIRPAMCRRYNSGSIKTCIDNRAQLYHNGLFESSKKLIDGFEEGARQAGLKNILYELNQSLYITLTDPLASKKWLNSLNVFTAIPKKSED